MGTSHSDVHHSMQSNNEWDKQLIAKGRIEGVTLGIIIGVFMSLVWKLVF